MILLFEVGVDGDSQRIWNTCSAQLAPLSTAKFTFETGEEVNLTPKFVTVSAMNKYSEKVEYDMEPFSANTHLKAIFTAKTQPSYEAASYTVNGTGVSSKKKRQ